MSSKTILNFNLEEMAKIVEEKRRTYPNVKIGVNDLTGGLLTSVNSQYIEFVQPSEDSPMYFTFNGVPLVNDNTVPMGEMQFLIEC